MNTWYLVETLTDDSATVVGEGGKVRGWTSVARLAPAPDVRIEPVIDAVRTSRRAWTKVVSSARTKKSFLLSALPVLGPSGDTHGVQVWIGDPDVPVDPPRIAAGIAWLLDRTVIAQTVEASMMSGVQPEDHVPERTPAEYYGKAAKFDDFEGLFALALNPQPGARWDSEMSVDHADGRTMRWWCWGKARVDEGNVGARLLWHDITDSGEPSRPTFAELAMKQGLAAAGVYTAVLDVQTRMLVAWLPRESPAPWVQWRDVESGSAVLHPDDHTVLDDAAARLDAGEETVRVRARVRGVEQDWVDTVLDVSKHAGPMSERIVVARMSLPS
ncbi:GAF domain-containing protein [Rhodococcus sp. HNM0569]|uniref:GAF domain-containing protein n=1 Tax=Rhodococcus sp. HNM0569 TaxID=2716340 RepID=UPI00146D1BC9|nr:GAF domain-containing protein [Rhodococcus sp. HNM0569]NLU83751.1 DUF5593 domain-containing protein [Rhodococcus sp. HNM0569]